jgi:hypothetical protein
VQPLTHHEILELVAPFSRRGRRADLAATDRLARRIAFQSIDHPEGCAGIAVRETLTLEDVGTGSYRLTRLLSPTSGPQASLEAVGTDPAELLTRIDAVPPQRHFDTAEGITTASSFRLPGSDAASMTFAWCRARVAGLDLMLDASTAKRGPAAVTLTHGPGDQWQLPQDTLAVLGGRWSRLKDAEAGWVGELRLRGSEPQRSRRAEAAAREAAQHLAHMLAETPRQFHERFIWARWRVFVRRLVPLVACIGLIVGAACAPKLALPERSGLRMLILNSPPLLMVLFFCLREIPVVEIPPVPRRSEAASWRVSRHGETSATDPCSPTR